MRIWRAPPRPAKLPDFERKDGVSPECTYIEEDVQHGCCCSFEEEKSMPSKKREGKPRLAKTDCRCSLSLPVRLRLPDSIAFFTLCVAVYCVSVSVSLSLVCPSVCPSASISVYICLHLCPSDSVLIFVSVRFSLSHTHAHTCSPSKAKTTPPPCPTASSAGAPAAARGAPSPPAASPSPERSRNTGAKMMPRGPLPRATSGKGGAAPTSSTGLPREGERRRQRSPPCRTASSGGCWTGRSA